MPKNFWRTPGRPSNSKCPPLARRRPCVPHTCRGTMPVKSSADPFTMSAR